MAGPQRIKKVNELIKRELGGIILKEVDFSKSTLVTITLVKTSKDLREAKVFVSIMPEKEGVNVLKTLKREIYHLQQLLNQRLVMRPVPKISFLEDTGLKKVQKVEKILGDIKKGEKS